MLVTNTKTIFCTVEFIIAEPALIAGRDNFLPKKLYSKISTVKLIIPDGKEYSKVLILPAKILPKITFTANTVTAELQPQVISAKSINKLESPSLAPGIKSGGNKLSNKNESIANVESIAVKVSFLVGVFIYSSNNQLITIKWQYFYAVWQTYNNALIGHFACRYAVVC